MTAPTVERQILSEEIIEHIAGRAPTYDKENRFFSEDFDELREAGYLRMAVPVELGGFGMSLAEVCQQQRSLALSCTGDSAGDEHAPVLDGRRRRHGKDGRHIAAVAA